MKATKLLAVLLAILMVIPAMVFPTAAEEANAVTTDNGVVEYRFRTGTSDDPSESERPYLNPAWPGKTNNNGRYGEIKNNNAGIRYEFPLESELMPETITISGNIYNDVWFKISFDGTNWVDGYKAEARVTSSNNNSFNLTENGNVAVAWENYLIRYGTAPTTMHMWVDNVYFENMTSNETKTGWGTFIANNVDTVVKLTYATDGTRYKYETVVFTPNTNSGPYTYAVDASGTNDSTKDCWYMDENASNAGTKIIQFAYAMTNSQLPEKLTWTAEIGQNLVLDFSVDNENWVELYHEVPGNVTTRKYVTFDITEDYLAKVAETPSSMLYIRLRSSRPGVGWGGAIGKKPVILYAGYGEQQITGDYITLDWTPHGEDQSLYYVGGASVSYADKEKTNPIGYFVDGNAKATIRYPLANVDLSSEILFTATTSQQLLLEVSLDGTNYVEAFRYNNDSGVAASASHSTGFSSYKRTFNLTAAVKEAAKIATSKNNLYIRFGDAYPSSGWGGRIDYEVTLNVRSAEGMEYAEVLEQTVVKGPVQKRDDGNYTFTGDVNTVLPWGDYSYNRTLWSPFNSDTVNSDGVLVGSLGKNNSVIFADNGYFTLRYYLPAGATVWQFSAGLGNEIGLYYAYTTDAATPHPVDDFGEYEMLWNYVDNNGGARPSGNMTFKAETTPEVEAKGGYVQLLFVDYSRWRQDVLKEEGYTDTASGYGPKIGLGTNFPTTFIGYYPTEAELHNKTNVAYDEYAHTVKESFTLTKVRLSGSKYSIAVGEDGIWETEDDTYAPYYIIDGTEPVWVSGGGLTNTIKGDQIDADTMTFPGDGNYQARFGDASRIIYRYEIPEYATAFAWTARVGGDYGIYYQFADSTPNSNPASGKWTYVRDYLHDVDEGGNLLYKLGNHPNATEMTISGSIDANETAKYVYLMFVDYDYELYGSYYGDGTGNTVEEPVLGATTDDWIQTSGYGTRIALGTEQSVDMAWTMSGKVRDFAQSVSSAQLSLTDNFNLNFKLALPASSNGDEIVSITWADGTPVEKVSLVDGGYLVKDILPQDMTKKIVVNFSGTCMDNTKYTAKTFTYSVQDYCQRMISKNEAYYATAYGFTAEKTAAFKQLLSDALAYGAAAQAYIFDDGDLATEGIIGLKTSTFEPLNKDNYAETLSGDATAQGAYKWTGVTLVLDNTVAIRYTLWTEAAAPTVIVNDVEYTPVAVDGKANYYTVDVPVMAGDFATNYVASFKGVEGGFTLTYSVNHYVARKYNPNTLVTGDLIAALYNYGASAAAYAAAN